MQAWVLVNRQVYAVPLRVARTFYVNSSLPPEDPLAAALGRRVVRTLPYGQEPHNVYQVYWGCCLQSIPSLLAKRHKEDPAH